MRTCSIRTWPGRTIDIYAGSANRSPSVSLTLRDGRDVGPDAPHGPTWCAESAWGDDLECGRISVSPASGRAWCGVRGAPAEDAAGIGVGLHRADGGAGWR